MMLPMVYFHGHFVDVRLQGIGSVGQRRKCESHIFLLRSNYVNDGRFDVILNVRKRTRGETSSPRRNDCRESADRPASLRSSCRTARSCRVCPPDSRSSCKYPKDTSPSDRLLFLRSGKRETAKRAPQWHPAI